MSKTKNISDLIRERIFGLYAGQKIMTADSFLTKDGKYQMERPVLQISGISGVFLQVKPLWKINYNDALEGVSKLLPEEKKLRRKIRAAFISTDHNSNLILSLH